METGRMPRPDEAATIIPVDTEQNNSIIRLDRTHPWKPQQETMFYWNPQAAEAQFLFNDRDPETGRVLTVLCDIQFRRLIRGKPKIELFRNFCERFSATVSTCVC